MDFDPFTLDQLRLFIAIAEEGNFSRAGRRLSRAQSAVSTAIGKLEDHLAVPLFDRSTRVPALTDQGRAVLAAARRVCGEVDALRRLCADMVQGMEASIAVCVDALFPLQALVSLAADFAGAFPGVDLRIDTSSVCAVTASVRQGRASLGVVTVAGAFEGLERRSLAPIRMLPAVSPQHPLGRLPGPLPSSRLKGEVQIVLSERVEAGAPDQCALSSRAWSVADLQTCRALVLGGLGWANLPVHLIHEDLRAGTLVPLRLEAWGEAEGQVHLAALHRAGALFGPGHRWLLNRLENLCVEG